MPKTKQNKKKRTQHTELKQKSLLDIHCVALWSSHRFNCALGEVCDRRLHIFNDFVLPMYWYGADAAVAVAAVAYIQCILIYSVLNCKFMKKTNSSERKTVKAAKRRMRRRSMLPSVSVQVFFSDAVYSIPFVIPSFLFTIQPHESPFDATVKATNRSEVILIAFEAVHWNTDHELTNHGFKSPFFNFVPFLQHSVSYSFNFEQFLIFFLFLFCYCFQLNIILLWFYWVCFELNGFI